MKSMTNRKTKVAAISVSLLIVFLALLLFGSISGEDIEMTSPIPLMTDALLPVSVVAVMVLSRFLRRK